MKITELNDKSVCILGYGREGRATLAALQEHAPKSRITIADASAKALQDVKLSTISGPDYLQQLGAFDVIIKSPGIPWHPAPLPGVHITSATQIFFDTIPTKTLTIGVTGSKGKSTTASLIYQVLRNAGRKAVLAGNIGEPMLGQLDKVHADTIVVLELSSYQLESLSVSPRIAVITSFFPDHLDYHGSLDAYFEAKRHITRYQTAHDTVFYFDGSTDCSKLASASAGHQIGFNATDFPGQPHDTSLASPGGLSDLAAALKVATLVSIEPSQAVSLLEAATGLPHRQQALGLYYHIKWIDDSAATTPQSTLEALDALGDQVDTIIVGGLDRGYDFTELGRKLAALPVRNLILFPETGVNIRQAIEAAPPDHTKQYLETADMRAAVTWAIKHTKPNAICLLSSGSPSYNLFADFYQRGDAFQSAIRSPRD